MKNASLDLITILILFILACAKQAPPPGGPIDKTPPRIIGAEPSPNTTAVSLDSEVKLVFSERVNRRSVEESFFISPMPEEAVEFKWKAKKLHIKLPGGLKPNKTYVLTIGTDTKDIRNNRMIESFTLAFATGDSLDRGAISGHVYAPGATKGTLVWAYSLSENPEPNPTQIKADYITQCGEDGSYTLSYISLDRYRLFAVNDKDGNLLYDPEYDLIGICTKDVFINSDSIRAINCDFQVSIEDTTRPGLARAFAQDQYHLTLRFDEMMSAENIDSLSSYVIERIENDKPVDSLHIQIIYQDPQAKSQVQLITEEQAAEAEYQVWVRNLFDLSHNPIDPDYQNISFTGSADPDSFKPRLIFISPQDSSFSVSLNASIDMIFSEALQESSFIKHFSMTDTLDQTVPGSIVTMKPSAFHFVPGQVLQSKMTYRISLPVDSVFDFFNNPLGDSSISIIFTTLNKDTLTSISGLVLDEAEEDSGKIYLEVTRVGEIGKGIQIALDEPEPYIFKDLFPGLYLIYGFRDRDGNADYSYGKISPFQAAERFIFYPDTIKTRSRWPNEGNNIIFRK